MQAAYFVAAAALIAVIAAIAVSTNRTLARESGKRPRILDLGYLGSSGWLSDTDDAENAYLESRLGGYNPDGTPSDPDALRKLAEEENAR